MALNQTSTKLNAEQALLNSIKIYLPDLMFSINDLKNPTVTSVCSFYTAFLEELGGNTSTVFQIQMNQMTLISHVDMYNATVPLFNLFYAVKYFLNNIGITDFSLSDIANPVPRRTLNHFGALMHFLAYCDETISGLQSELQEVSNIKEQRDELIHKIEILRSDINQKATERVKRKERRKELDKIIEIDKVDLNKRCSDKESLKQAMENVKRMVLQYEEKENELVRTIKSMEDENDRLQTMIVKSPERLKTDLKQLSSKKEEFMKNVKDLKIQVEAKKKLTNDHTKEQENQEIRLEILKELIHINKILSEKNMENDNLLKESNKIVEQEEEMKQEIMNEQHKLKTLQETLSDLKTRKGKKESENNILLSAEKEYKALLQKQEDRSQYLSHIRENIKELKEEIEKLNNELKKLISMYQEEHDEVSNLEDQLIQKYTTLQHRLRKTIS